MRKSFVLIILAAGLLAGCGGGGGAAKLSSGDVAVVGSQHISLTAMNNLLARAKLAYKQQGQAFPKQGTTNYQAVRDNVVTLLVEQAELDQKAAAMGIKVTDAEIDARIDAYVPAAYIAAEALKIDLHRRLALTESEDELHELRVATEDRYGPLPEPVENLFAIQEAKLKLAVLGADYLVFRGGKASVGPVVLGSGELRDLRAEVETAVYSTGNREVTLRISEFRGALDLVGAMLAARQAA